jgi:type II secretory pathway pseudopilin PulG
MINNKKGAMFGLDARIALAIFGALSVISGAALYSAIQSSKVTSLLVFFEETNKAVEQYYLDVGIPMPTASNTNIYFVGNLYENFEGVEGWKGPYFGDGATQKARLSSSFVSKFFGDGLYNDSMNIRKALGEDWTGTDSDFPTSCSSDDCHMYLYVSASAATTSAEEKAAVSKYSVLLDELVDNGDGSRKGKIRYRITGNSADSHMLFYKTDIADK